MSPRRALGVALAAVAFLGGGYLIVKLRSQPAGQLRFQRVTFQLGTIHRARFAPDNQTIVYAMVAVGDDLKPGEIFATRVDSLDARSLGLSPADVLSVSSTGHLAISLPPAEDPLFFGRGTLAEVSLSGGAPRQLLERVTGADWSPDGRELAVTREVGDRMQLEFPLGKVVHEGIGLWSPRVSPDGMTVAFEEGEPRASLRLVDRKGQTRTILENTSGFVAWSPRGDEIWWSRNKIVSVAENTEVHAVDLSGHDRTVATLAGDFFLHDVSHDGRLLVERNELSHDVVASIPGQAERNLEWLDQSIPVALSPDNRTLLFTDRGDTAGRTTGVYVRGTDGSPAVRLGEGWALALSPDGRWALAGRARGVGNDQLVLLPTGAGQERSLPTGSLVFNRFNDWAAFHPDGKSVLFSAVEPGHRVRVFRQSLDGGAPRAVSVEGIQPSLISPDGTRVLARKVESEEIGLVTLDGPDPQPLRTVVRLPQTVAPVHWSADGRSVLIEELFSRPVRVDRLDLMTGERTPWRSFSAGRRMPSGGLTLVVSVHEDSWVAGYSRLFSQLVVVDGLR